MKAAMLSSRDTPLLPGNAIVRRRASVTSGKRT
jgi:hypothetical protein